MTMSRSRLMPAFALLLAAAAPAPVLPAQVDLTHAQYWRLYTGPDGNTAAERLQWTGTAMHELGSSHGIVQFYTAPAKSVVVIAGKPGWVSPLHNVGRGRELVVVLAGTSIGHYANGNSQVFHAGDIVLIEDQGSKGRSVEFGGDGYLSVTVPLDDSVTASPK